MAKRQPTYDNQFKAGCITLMLGANYPEDRYALTRVADRTGVTRRTLYRWWDLYHGDPDAVPSDEPVPEKVTALVEAVTEQKLALVDMLDYVVHGMISEVKRRVDEKDLADVSVPQLMTGAAIGIDKMRLLSDQSTENNAVTFQVVYTNDWRAPTSKETASDE
jgi:transposase-like protein